MGEEGVLHQALTLDPTVGKTAQVFSGIYGRTDVEVKKYEHLHIVLTDLSGKP